MYFYDYNEDGKAFFGTKRINPLLVWFYKLQKQKLYNDICVICDKEFKFYKKRFESRIDVCYNCDPSEYTDY